MCDSGSAALRGDNVSPARFVHLSEKQKQVASYKTKRRASEEAGPLQRAAQGEPRSLLLRARKLFSLLRIRVRSGTLRMKTRMPLPMMIIIPLLMERHLLMGLVLYRHRPLTQGMRRRALLPAKRQGAQM
ncbi:hypothetical protein Taro_056704 [Colocasia esculenta]|uniref:Uncharacterized protein n=1 Tax=Colocasia esculenta TaxID=4460 RepID=A0A843XY74_COLES|nr:hypothetical protein [Colocasia esculenta]